MVAARRFTRPSFLLLLLAVVAASFAGRPALANPLPPNPVLGHPADYVIITPSALAPEFQRLATFKTHTGVPALVKTLESIHAEYPAGRDDAERMRLFLQDAKQQWNTHWLLLGGLPPDLPARRVHSTFFGGMDFVTDLYFGALQGTWDADGDGIFGEGFNTDQDPGDSVDFTVDVFVGRAPVRTVAEAHDFVSKTLLAYAEPWEPVPHQALLAADVFFPRDWTPGVPITLDGADLAEQVRAIIVATPGVHVERLYQNWNDPRWPDAQPISHDALLAALRAGTDFFLGENFGGPLVMTAGTDSVPAADLAALTDAPRPTRAWITGSYTGNFEGDCLASAFVRGASGGAAACVASSTALFISASQYYQTGFASAFYPPASKSVAEALADAKAPFITFSQYDGVHRLSQMELNVIGDPGIRLRPIASGALEVGFPAAVAVGSPGIDVSVASAGVPISGARVSALFEDLTLAVASTDASGNAHLDLLPSHAGAMSLAVTAPDGRLFEGTIAVDAALAVETRAELGSRLDAPTPNPAFASVRFAGAAEAGASLAIYDLSGRRLRAFALAPGHFDLRWDLRDENGRGVPAGLYFTRLSSGTRSFVQRLLVTR